MGGDNDKTVPAKQQKEGGFSSLINDLVVLQNIWFHRVSGDDHASRLDSFYRGQKDQYDQFRSRFLWGRRPMLQQVAERLSGKADVIWVDLGGGTGENVAMMNEYMPLSSFKHIYVVDLCKALCEVAQSKAERQGWSNVTVVEGDACTWKPPPDHGSVTVVTFSYSLSMIPPFFAAADNARAMLDPKQGILAVADFAVSSKYDLPYRQMGWLRRFFWRATFDTDGIDVGPERRMYLDHTMQRIYEDDGEGSIPYVPFLRAPYYVWVGKLR